MQKKSIPIFLTIQVESASSHPLLTLFKPWQLKEWLTKQRYIYKYELETFSGLTLCTWIAAVKFLKTAIICKIRCDIAIELTTIKIVHTLSITVASTFPLSTWVFYSAARIQVFIVWSVAYWSSTYIWSSKIFMPNFN